MFSAFSDMNHLYSESRSNKIAFRVAHMAFAPPTAPVQDWLHLSTCSLSKLSSPSASCAWTRAPGFGAKSSICHAENLTSPLWQFAEEICTLTQDWAKLEGISCEGHLLGSLLSLKHPFSNSAHQYTKMLLVLKELSKTSSFRVWKNVKINAKWSAGCLSF